MSLLVVNSLTFLAVFMAICAGNAVLLDFHSSERRRVRQRMDEQFRAQQRERARTSPQLKDFSKIAAQAKAEGQSERRLADTLTFMLEQSGLDLTLAQLFAYMAMSGAVVGVVTGILLRNVVIGFVAGAVCSLIPLGYVQRKRQKRLDALREQLPDAFELMSRVLRAGQSISQAIQAVADEFSSPISLEFLYCYEQMNLGLPAEAALRELGRRTGLLEIKIFIVAVVVHRQTGGNLAQLLDKLALVVRERFRIRGMIRSLTAQGRFQASILLSLPPFMFLLLLLLHYDYEITLLQFPWMIAAALTMMAAGALWIRKVVNFDY